MQQVNLYIINAVKFTKVHQIMGTYITPATKVIRNFLLCYKAYILTAFTADKNFSYNHVNTGLQATHFAANGNTW